MAIIKPQIKSGASFILDALQKEKITRLFLVPGGLVDEFMNEFGQTKYKLKPIIAAHEAGAGFMADGYARWSGRFGVCMGIGGPGAANLVAPLASAYADGSPVLAIVGEVGTDFRGRGAFQDGSPDGLHDLACMGPITKQAREIPTVDLIPDFLQGTMRAMLSGRRGPVCLTIPTQVQTPFKNQKKLPDYKKIERTAHNPPSVIDINATRHVSYIIRNVKKVAILAGIGVAGLYTDGQGKSSYAGIEYLKSFAEAYEIPVATTLRAKGVFPEDHRLSLGVFGYSGTRHSYNALLDNGLDALLVVGSSLNQRNTMKWNQKLKKARIIHVDIDQTVFDQNFTSDRKVNADAAEFFKFFVIKADPKEKKFAREMMKSNDIRSKWIQEIKKEERFYNIDPKDETAIPINPGYAIRVLRECASKETVALVDSGAHRAFAGHYWESYGANEYLTATALAPMGWSIPACIGSKLARPEFPHVVIIGDGCMLMHGIEIQTAARYKIPMVVVIINNSALGNVYLRAKKMKDSSKEMVSLPTHDWVKIAKALGGDGKKVTDPKKLRSVFKKAFKYQGPFVVDVRCDKDIPTPIGEWGAVKSGVGFHD